MKKSHKKVLKKILKILKKILFTVAVAFVVAFIFWLIFHSIFGAKVTFWTILMINGAKVVVVFAIEHIVRDTYYKHFLFILLRKLYKKMRNRKAIHEAKAESDVRIYYFLALLIALNMKRQIRSRRHHSTTMWKKLISYLTFGYY
jgi:hypothetical protein